MLVNIIKMEVEGCSNWKPLLSFGFTPLTEDQLLVERGSESEQSEEAKIEEPRRVARVRKAKLNTMLVPSKEVNISK